MIPEDPAVFDAPFDAQVRVFIDQHREMLASCVEDLTEEEAQLALVPSKTTLLGLVKHAAFVERVWFGEAPLPLRWVQLHVLRELAQHCGHAEILREQVLARRVSG